MSTTTHPVTAAVANVEARRQRHQDAVMLGQAMGARRLLADLHSGRERFQSLADLIWHVETISARLFRNAGERALFSHGYMKECNVWR